MLKERFHLKAFLSVNGIWALWSAWSDCSLTCGKGKQSRKRICANPAPQFNGDPCPGLEAEDQFCNDIVCPSELYFSHKLASSKPFVFEANGVWGQWTAWGDCTKECETGTQTRTRTCDSPAPANGGLSCVLPGSENMDCNTHLCPGLFIILT